MLSDWLNTVCRMLSAVDSAALFAIEHKNYVLQCEWPASGSLNDASRTNAEQQVALALLGNKTVVSYTDGTSDNQCIIAHPFVVSGGQQFVIVTIFSDSSVNPRNQISLLEWGVAWLRLLNRQQTPTQSISNSSLISPESERLSKAEASSRSFIEIFKSYRFPLLITLLFIVLLFALPVDRTVKAPVVMEGKIQRSLTVPVDSFIKEVVVKAGDLVEQGALMVSLDDTELRLKLDQAVSDRTVADKKHRQALAKLDFSEASQYAFDRDIAAIDIRLIEQQLSRLALKAPITGQVISGDINRAAGSAVERGQILFELAPVGDYRVVLNIDETDIRYVEIGQQGEVLLRGLGSQLYPIEIDTVSSIFSPEQGQRYYHSEAHLLSEPGNKIKPGMEGSAHIVTGQQSLGIALFDPFYQWFRELLWKWWP
ncbi:efflux RND transporter periplasmic adaptor subunit [Amphritea sp.]|uniref:efflux RND transporter periplasmic adaptor subunit n=1 Tax=Amphritea sp. TaxID=1872502 RepID=UPI0025C07937|nr:efflux RND transporter periplasmic adaptor subunit [Amphritea sp.]